MPDLRFESSGNYCISVLHVRETRHLYGKLSNCNLQLRWVGGFWKVFQKFPFFIRNFFNQKFSRSAISKHIYFILYIIVIPDFPHQLHWWVLKSFPETPLFIRKCFFTKSFPGFPHQFHRWVLKSFPEILLFYKKKILRKVFQVFN